MVKLETPKDITALYLVKYPEGHPQGPWEATISYLGEERWWKGYGPSPQAAIDSAKDMGAKTPVSYSRETSERKQSIKAQAADLLAELGL